MRRTDSRELDGRVIQLPMVDVHTVGRRRRLDRLARLGRRAAGRPALGGGRSRGPPATGAAAPSRRSPTPTSLLGYLGPSTRELAGGVELDADAAKAAVARLADELGLEQLEAAEGIVRVANTGDGARAARRHGRARGRPARLRADAVRRRRADARGRDRRGARDRADPLPAGERRAVGARPDRLRAPPRHRAHRDAAAATSSPPSGSRRGGRARARRSAEGLERRRGRGHLRAALPRPGVRARRCRRRATRPRRARRALRRRARAPLRLPRRRGARSSW